MPVTVCVRPQSQPGYQHLRCAVTVIVVVWPGPGLLLVALRTESDSDSDPGTLQVVRLILLPFQDRLGHRISSDRQVLTLDSESGHVTVP